MKIILTGVDASETARRAAEVAAELASSVGGELLIISAFKIKISEAYRVQNRNRSTERLNVYSSLQEKYQREAEEAVSSVADGLSRRFPELKITWRAVQGEAGFALVNVAEEVNADIIVVGNRRVQGPTRILGSIAQTVASEATCDLYIANTRQI